MKILLVNGVNMATLGIREPGIYGDVTLKELEKIVTEYAEKKNVEVECFQSDIEGEICSKITTTDCDAIILNAGAYSHYSIAIRDAVSASQKPCVEVHISNLFAREKFRSESVIAPVTNGVITGFGIKGYLLAVDYFAL